MKIAFYKATRKGWPGIYNRLVRFIEGSPYSHCELVFADGLCASASHEDGGIRFKDFVPDDSRWDVFDLPKADEAYARAWFEQNLGAPYDWRGVWALLIPALAKPSVGWFCSSACAAALQLHGDLPSMGLKRLVFALKEEGYLTINSSGTD
jgi:hypothetical protein